MYFTRQREPNLFCSDSIRFMKWFKDHLTTIVVNVIIGIALFFVGVWWNARETRTKYIEYYVTQSTDFTQSLEEIGDSVMFVINSKKVDNISLVTVYVMNSTDNDYEDIPIYIDLSIPGEDVQVISTNYYDHNRSQESITAENASRSRFPGGVRYGYMLKIMNRANNSINRPALEVKFLIETSSPVDYQVQVNKTSLDIRETSLGRESETNAEVEATHIIFMIVISAFMVFFIITTYQRRLLKGLRAGIPLNDIDHEL